MDGSAVFSDDGVYRYSLGRHWGGKGEWLGFVLLNPSTADAKTNDPTIARGIVRSQRLSYVGLIVCNLFGFCATDPKAMMRAVDPIGPGNDVALLAMAQNCPHIVLGWGAHGGYRNRGEEVIELLRKTSSQLMMLGVTKGGEPKHPLYIGYDVPLQPWQVAA